MNKIDMTDSSTLDPQAQAQTIRDIFDGKAPGEIFHLQFKRFQSDGGFLVTCPELSNFMVAGSFDEALKAAAQVLPMLVDALLVQDDTEPADTATPPS